MPDNPTTALVKAANSPALARVSNQLALTEKLLAKPEEPFLIPYRKGKKWGFCDRNKNILVDCKYLTIGYVLDGFWRGMTDMRKTSSSEYTTLYYLLNRSGEIINNTSFESISGDPENKLMHTEKYGKHSCVDYSGKNVLGIFTSDDYIEVGEGMASIYNKKNKWFFFIDIHSNNEFSEMSKLNIFQYVSTFSEGLVAFSRSKIGPKVGFINRFNDVVIEPMYDIPDRYLDIPITDTDNSYKFIGGLCSVCLNGKWGVINFENQVVIPFNYQNIYRESEEGCFLAVVDHEIDLHEHFDRHGKFVKLPLSPGINITYNLEIFPGEQNKKWGYMNKNFDIIIDPQYDEVSYFSDGLAAVEKNSLWGYINKFNETIIDFKFTHARNFTNGLCLVRNGDKWGFIDKYGRVVIGLKYSSLWSYSNLGLAEAFINNNFVGYIDQNGTEYWED